MVEKVIISPTKVRAHGNIMMVKSIDDYTTMNAGLTTGTDTINGQTESVFVAVYDEEPMSVALTSTETSISVGESALLSATVTDDGSVVEDATVTFKAGGDVLGSAVTDANGVATYTFTSDGSGVYGFVARSGTVESTRVWVTVNRVSTSTSLSSSSGSVSYGDDVTLSATVTSGASPVVGCNVCFKDGDVVLDYGITNASGVAVLTIDSLSVGQHTVTACVVEDDVYAYSVSTGVSVTVSKVGTTTVLTSSGTSVLLGTSVTLSATVVRGASTPLSGVSVRFLDNDASVGVGVTDASGVATLSLASLGSGTHEMEAVVAETSEYLGSISSSVSVVVYTSSGDLDEYMRWIDYTDDLGNQSSDGEFLRGLDNMIQSINGRGDL